MHTDANHTQVHTSANRCDVLSISKSVILVNKSGTVFPGGGDRAMLESNLSTPSARRGKPYRFSYYPDGLKAKNSSFLPTGFISIPTNCDKPVISQSAQILEQFLQYKYQLAHTPSTFLHLGNKNDDSEVIFRVDRKAGSRYFQEGRRRIKNNLHRRLCGTRKKGILMTCTVDTKRYDVVEAWQMVWKRFKKLRDALNQYRMREQGAKGRVRYIAILEQTKRGYPHLHVFFPGLSFLIDDLSKLDEWWGMGGKGSVDVEASKGSHSARGYILKYIGKMSGWSDLCMAIMWKFGIRLYNLSHKAFYVTAKAAEWTLKAVYCTVEEMMTGLGLDRGDILGILGTNEKFIYIRSP